MLEFLGSFIGGALAEYLLQRRKKPLYAFLATFSIFTILFAIGLPLSLPPDAPQRSWSYVIAISTGLAFALALMMLVLLHFFGRKSNEDKSAG
ncbi:conserved protein of unknown function [Burkholderia multivorans]